MPMTSVTLKPGVNTERTLALNEAGVSQSQLLRYKDGLIQTLGGWNPTALTVPSTVRDIHAWVDITGTSWAAMAATNNLIVSASSVATDVMPRTFTTNLPTSAISVSSGLTTITVTDPDSGPTTYNTVYFNTPISIDGFLLAGAYQIAAALSTGSYTIESSYASSSTTTASFLPGFNTTAGSANITVTLPNYSLNPITAASTTLGLQFSFRAPTTVGGLTVSGPYSVTSIIDSTSFVIATAAQASSTSSATMNSSLIQLVYYVTLGPQAAASGFGAGGFGSGGFGIGTGSSGTSGGSAIATTNWSQDNWGEVLLACPKDGAIYTWAPDSGFFGTKVITSAPFFNGGIFISMPQQILVAWKSDQTTSTQDNLLVRWSDALDYTNWTVSNQTTAGSFHIPTGSLIVGGMQAPNYGVIWTDVDVWIMQYIGGDLIFNFTRAGAGCGLIGQHAAGVIAGNVYWCGHNNFYTLGPSGAQVIPCAVWDRIFQNLNTAEVSKISCAPNSVFNEIAWFFPSATATENDSYVKYNILENEWDYGSLQRTAWVDINTFGYPIATDPNGSVIYHENTQNQSGAPVTSFRTGWFSITDGNDLVFIDWMLPDFIWSLYSGSQDAQVNITVYAADYPGDTPRTYGPFTVTQQTEYINPRLRGRLISLLVSSNNNIFWRLGRIRFRFAASGRR